MPNIAALTAELTAGHPDTGAYNVDNALALAELNAVNRPIATVTIERVLRFLLLENTHQTDGDDTQDRSIWLRMSEVAELPMPTSGTVANPWNSTAVGALNEIKIIKTKQLLAYFTLSAQGGLDIDLTDTNFQVYLAGAESAGCMSADQKAALLDLPNNLQSRAQEISHLTGIPVPHIGHVEEARS